ncbi:phage tail protein [Bacillus sp. SA1-12]|uniref:phage tail protein n=1 Tax=Bacillus sp. SA1-12 TaxID=1455638 RepID=UPI000699037D|nr:phage tail protein [Bacillus sp. SA1-12]
MLAIKDLNGTVYLLTGASNIIRKRRVNGEKEFSFKLEKTKQNAHFFDAIDKYWRLIDFVGEEYPIVYYRDVSEGNSYSREISCLHSFYDDMRNHYIYEIFTGTKTFVDMMNFIFEGSGYTFNIIGSFYAQNFENFGDDFGLELFKTALERYKSEFKVQGKFVTLQDKIGNTTDFQYRHKFNLESIEREVDALDFSTYGEGFGKDKLHVTYRSPLADIYGERPIKAIRDERFTNAENLKNKVKEAVDKSLKISLTVKLSDLRANGYNKNHPDEGDVIILVEDRFNMKVDTRIVEIVELLDKKGKVIDCDVTLSNFSNIFEQQRRMHNATKSLADAIEGKRPLPFEALAIAVQQATIALQNAQTELQFPDNGGILAIDKTNPNKLVLFNSAGIGISDDGGQTFENALTGSGLVADVVTTGTINTAFVRIQGATGKMYITGDQFKSIDYVDPSKYVEIVPGMLTVGNGAIKIIRPDGAVWVENGVPKQDVAVQETSPKFIGYNTTERDRYYRTTVQTYEELGAYRTTHVGRYLKVEGYAIVNNGDLGLAVQSYAGGISFYQVMTIHYDPNSIGGTFFEMTIDLGKPSYSSIRFYIKFRSIDAAEEVGCRIDGVYQFG